MPEDLNQTTRTFRASVNDGSVVLYKVAWQGFVNINVHEDGGPSTWTDPIDDRRCSWNISGWITRRVAISIAGQDYWNDTVSKIFNQGHAGEGGAFVLQNLRPENCNDCRDRRDSDYNDMRNTVNGALEGVANSDVEDVIAAIRGLPGVISVNA